MLREPIGKYKVGISKYDTKEIGSDPYKRRVSLTIFYPTDEWDRECPYRNSDYLINYPDSEDNGVHTYCGDNPDIIREDFGDGHEIAHFPVVLYNHGLCGHEMESTVLCADIASSGYVVVSIGHPYGAGCVSYSDGTVYADPESFTKMRFRLNEIAPLWYEDMLAATELLKEMNGSDSIFKGRLLLDKTGVIGVSFGGCCGVIAAMKCEEIKYAVNLDGSMFVEPEYRFPNTPVLVMCSPMNRIAYTTLVKHNVETEIMKIRKVSHYEFSDGVYLSDRGKSNREWADRVSTARAEKIIEFINDAMR